MHSIIFDPYVGTQDKYTAEQIVRFTLQAGYSGYNLPNVPAFQEKDGLIDIPLLRSLAEETGLAIHSFLAWGPRLTDPVVGFDEIEAHYEYALEVCRELKIPYVSIWPSSIGLEISKAEAFDCLASNLIKLVPRYQSDGVTLLVEFQPEYTPVENVSEAISLVNAVSSKLKISCDTTHISNSEQDITNAIKRLAPYLGDVHISGRHRKSPIIDPCDYDTIFEALHDINYSGAFMVQYHLDEDLSTIEQVYQFVRELEFVHFTDKE